MTGRGAVALCLVKGVPPQITQIDAENTPPQKDAMVARENPPPATLETRRHREHKIFEGFIPEVLSIYRVPFLDLSESLAPASRLRLILVLLSLIKGFPPH